jgi:hypothetical protein
MGAHYLRFTPVHQYMHIAARLSSYARNVPAGRGALVAV